MTKGARELSACGMVASYLSPTVIGGGGAWTRSKSGESLKCAGWGYSSTLDGRKGRSAMHPNVSWQPEGLALAKCTNHALHSFRPIFGGVEGFCEKEQRRMRNKRDTRDTRDMRDKSRKSLGGVGRHRCMPFLPRGIWARGLAQSCVPCLDHSHNQSLQTWLAHSLMLRRPLPSHPVSSYLIATSHELPRH